MPLVVVHPRYKPPRDPNEPFFPPLLKDFSGRGPVDEPVTYTDGQGNIWDLSTYPDVRYKEGINGRFMPAIQHYSESVPEQDGARYRGTRVIPRTFTLSLTVVAEDITTLRSHVREIAQFLNPTKGVGKLTVYTADGLVRYAHCVYESGFEADPATDGFQYEQRLAIVFRAFDPFWYDQEPIVQTLRSNVASSFFPIFPVQTGENNIFRIWEESNRGDVEAWPVWTIRGPGRDLTLQNETTGQSLFLGYEIPSDSEIQIDTRPGVKSVLAAGNESIFPLVDGSLWALSSGPNDLTVLLSGATVATYLTLSYQQRFLGV